MNGAKEVASSGTNAVPEIYVLSEENRLRPTTGELDREIPVVDLSCFFGTGDDRQQQQLSAINEVAHACETWGFFQVINHGIDENIVSSIFQAGHDFFDLPPDEKNKHVVSDKWKDVQIDSYGLFSYGVSFNAATTKTTDWRDWVRIEGTLAQKHGALPDNPPSLRRAVTDFENALIKLKDLILELISRGLGLEHDRLRQMFGETMRDYLLFNLYPQCPNPELVAGLSAHSDPLAFTILAQESVPGLEISHAGSWVLVKPIPGAFVVNLGDLMQIFSNGRYKSVEHRVRANAKERLSVAMHVGPSTRSSVAPLAQLVSVGNPARYRPCTAGEYMDHFYTLKLQGKSCLDYVAISS